MNKHEFAQRRKGAKKDGKIFEDWTFSASFFDHSVHGISFFCATAAVAINVMRAIAIFFFMGGTPSV